MNVSELLQKDQLKTGREPKFYKKEKYIKCVLECREQEGTESYAIKKKH